MQRVEDRIKLRLKVAMQDYNRQKRTKWKIKVAAREEGIFGAREAE